MPVALQGSVGRGGKNLPDDVCTVQALLNRALPPPYDDLDVDGKVGRLTIGMIEEYQRRVVGFQRPDGRVDPSGATFQALVQGRGPFAKSSPTPAVARPAPAAALPGGGAVSAIAEEAVRMGLTQDGVRESGGPNRGPEVNLYHLAGGSKPGHAWCASFVSWCFVRAAAKLGVANPFRVTSWCPTIYARGQSAGKLVAQPQRGDIFLKWSTSSSRHSHTGLVTGASGNVFTTIEGNTNNNGSREGIGVFQLTRKRATARYDFVRY
jgi:hypothetical protein